MIIERIEPVPMQERTFKVRFADGTAVKTQDYVISDHGLRPGMDLEGEDLERFLRDAGLASAKNRAVRIIAAAGVSKGELHRRLTRKGETPEDAREAVAWLEELNLLDDGETAAQLVRSALAKGYGKARIKQILFEKQIPQDLWEAALAQVPDQSDTVDKLLSQRLRGQKPDQKELKRTIDALLRKGHSWADIRAGLARYDRSMEDTLEEIPYE